MPDLARRVGTAAVLLAVLLAALFLLPPDGIAALVAAILGISALEWARLCGFAGLPARFYAAGIVLAFFVLFMLGVLMPALIAAALFWIVAAPAWMWAGIESRQQPALAIAGVLVLVPAALAMSALRPQEVLAVLAVAWIADTAAYFVGGRWGRHKLAPSISPGKTWEGAAGGLAGVLAYAMILSIWVAGARMPALFGAAVLLTAVSIIGDLFESAAKRQAGVKDSGTLLPGHGGVLDRIDSATATLPLAAMMMPFMR